MFQIVKKWVFCHLLKGDKSFDESCAYRFHTSDLHIVWYQNHVINTNSRSPSKQKPVTRTLDGLAIPFNSQVVRGTFIALFTRLPEITAKTFHLMKRLVAWGSRRFWNPQLVIWFFFPYVFLFYKDKLQPGFIKFDLDSMGTLTKVSRMRDISPPT